MNLHHQTTDSILDSYTALQTQDFSIVIFTFTCIKNQNKKNRYQTQHARTHRSSFILQVFILWHHLRPFAHFHLHHRNIPTPTAYPFRRATISTSHHHFDTSNKPESHSSSSLSRTQIHHNNPIQIRSRRPPAIRSSEREYGHLWSRERRSVAA